MISPESETVVHGAPQTACQPCRLKEKQRVTKQNGDLQDCVRMAVTTENW